MADTATSAAPVEAPATNGNGAAPTTTTAPAGTLKNINDLVVPSDAPAVPKAAEADADGPPTIQNVYAPGGVADNAAPLPEVEEPVDLGEEEEEEDNKHNAHHDDGHAEEESDEYDFEEEQQVPENEGDQYVVGEEEEEDEDEGEQEGEAGPNAPQQKPSLTALLLGDPSAPEHDEDDYQDDGDDDADINDDDNGDEDYNDDDDDNDDYMEESTPITPTSRKRAIAEAVEDDDEAEDGEAVSKKVKS